MKQYIRSTIQDQFGFMQGEDHSINETKQKVFVYKTIPKTWTLSSKVKVEGPIFSEKTPDFESYARKAGPVFSEKVESSGTYFPRDGR